MNIRATELNSGDNDLVDAATHFEPAQMLSALVAATKSGKSLPQPDRLPLTAITTMSSLFQPRGMSEKHIGDLTRAIQNFGDVDPVTVIAVGNKFVLIDGHHRLVAYEQVGKICSIPVRYFEGTPQEAVLEAGQANSKAKLPMMGVERQNYAWRLVLLGKHSKAQITKASGVSAAQVGNMRAALKKLGAEAFECASWWQALERSKGKVHEMSPEDRDQWKEDLANDFADRLAKHFSTRLADRPEVAAMAFAAYFGRRLPELVNWLHAYVPDAEDLEEEF